MIGETFAFDVLHAVFPVDLDKAMLSNHLNTLVFKNFLTAEDSPTGGPKCFKFTHSMVRVAQRSFFGEEES